MIQERKLLRHLRRTFQDQVLLYCLPCGMVFCIDPRQDFRINQYLCVFAACLRRRCLLQMPGDGVSAVLYGNR